MVHIDRIAATARSVQGSSACRRLRREGFVPGNLYGHEQDPEMISFEAESIRHFIESGTKVADLEVDGRTEKVLLRDVQWNTFSTEVLHCDFLRVDPNERIETDVPLILRGTAPGSLAGGIVEQPLHSLHVDCLAVELPDSIDVRITSLQVEDSLCVKDLAGLPPSLNILTPEDEVIVHVLRPRAEEEAEAPAEGEGEVEEAPAEE